MSNYEVMGNLKKVMDYSKDGKPNWYAIINDSDDKDHRAYSNQDLTSFNNQLSDPSAVVLVDVKGETAIHKSGKNAGQPYIKNAIITRMGDEQSEQPKPTVPAKQNGVQDYTRVPDANGLTREEGMLVIGIWTRGITSGKTSEQVGAYCSDALIDYRNKNKGDDDVPF
jgi:hypothetical protein|tara:strand:- start:660 stop:1163 length:504 start_codon:yes stop_codon:yes gene_type:complete